MRYKVRARRVRSSKIFKHEFKNIPWAICKFLRAHSSEYLTIVSKIYAQPIPIHPHPLPIMHTKTPTRASLSLRELFFIVGEKHNCSRYIHKCAPQRANLPASHLSHIISTYMHSIIYKTTPVFCLYTHIEFYSNVSIEKRLRLYIKIYAVHSRLRIYTYQKRDPFFGWFSNCFIFHTHIYPCTHTHISRIHMRNIYSASKAQT